jgi:hypothetical protein
MASAPESLWAEIEPLLTTEDQDRTAHAGFKPRPTRSWGYLAVAAAALLLVLIAISWFATRRSDPEKQAEQAPPPVESVPDNPARPPDQPLPAPAPKPDEMSPPVMARDVPGGIEPRPAWRVESLEGSPQVASAPIKENGLLAEGQWLETDGRSKAKIDVADIGQVEVDPNSRVQLVRTRATEHRLALQRGVLKAKIVAPPRLFFVNTPSAVAVDYGCAYTLKVDDSGVSYLRVDTGWVLMVARGRESMVPADGVCVTKPGIGPGTPYFEDASEVFLNALTRFDFQNGGDEALAVVLSEARKRDTLTLINLLHRVGRQDRSRVYDRMVELAPPPAGVTRTGVLRLDDRMLEQWMMALTWIW